MERIKYFDFDLSIERAGDHYRARVMQSPAGQASAEFTLPFSDIEIENLMLRVGRARRGVRRLESPEMQAAKQFGGKLFDAVFAGDVRGALRSSIDSTNREGAGLRLRLRLGDAPELIDLPWEFLYNASLNRFLSLSNKTPLVRYIELPETPRPLKIAPPLRVLVMISSPSDYEALDVESEWKKLNDALRDLIGNNSVMLERLDTATLAALRRKLRQSQYHVLHFIGHGGFDAQSQDGLLILEDEQGRGRRTSGQYLATVLNDHDSLRLVVLNACEGARAARSDPFAGVAQSLVQQGVPAVIAMQFEISDGASITFAHEFYAAIADGAPVDAALGDARGAIFTEVNDLEWGTPVLYLRAPDGIIFTPLSAQELAQREQARLAAEQRQREEQARERTRLVEEQRARERNQQIENLYHDAESHFAQNDFDAAEKNLAALFALDASNVSAQALQKKIQAARESIKKEQELSSTEVSTPISTPEPTRRIAPTPSSSASAVPFPKQYILPIAALLVIGFLLVGGGIFINNIIKPTPTIAPPTFPGPVPNPAQLPTEINIPGETQVPSPAITIQQRGTDNAPMVFVPAGGFLMGSGANEFGQSHEKPQHTVVLDAFWIDRHEVTNAQYIQCVDAGKCKPPPGRHSFKRGAYYGVAEFDNYPVIDVSWTDAQGYCAWAGKRLPTEAEWEKAARGTDGRIYPWGNEFDQNRVNNNEVVGDTTEVGKYPNGASPYGALDMAGNVWEYVNDWYDEFYYSNSPRTNPTGATLGIYRVRRGGSMLSVQGNVRAAQRSPEAPDYHDFQGGFRCAQTAQQSSETQVPPTQAALLTATSPPSTETPQPSAQPTATTAPPTHAPTRTLIPPTKTSTRLPPSPAFPAGTLQTRGTDNAPMVFVPGGAFTMGSAQGFVIWQPVHQVVLDAFWIDQHEVTNAQYKLCVDAGVCKPPSEQTSYTRSSYYGNSQFDNYPVIYVSWNDADKYCKWANKRLPTEAQWEKAARGTDARAYPWGNEFDQSRVNINLDGDTTQVGAFPNGASPYGVLDMAGNVYEWIADWYDANYYSVSPRNNPTGPSSGQDRVFRGGGWSSEPSHAYAFNRFPRNPETLDWYSGIRCVQPDS